MAEFNANEELAKRLKQRDAFGWVKYGKPVTKWDGRNTIVDAIEEALDLAVYLTKLNEERKDVASLLEEASEEIEQPDLFDRCLTMAKRLRDDTPRVGDENYVPAMVRLEQMDAYDAPCRCGMCTRHEQ